MHDPEDPALSAADSGSSPADPGPGQSLPTESATESSADASAATPRGSVRGGPITDPAHPLYKGAPLEADRGPGLGCFWTQVVLLVILLALVPIGVVNAWPIQLTAGLLILALVIVLFVSLTTIFLLRLVAADRRARRAPLRSGARPTVGQLEDARAAADTLPPDEGSDQPL